MASGTNTPLSNLNAVKNERNSDGNSLFGFQKHGYGQVRLTGILSLLTRVRRSAAGSFVSSPKNCGIE
jgi:hypothetical protein